jgi:hypothetical protein
MRSTPRSAGPVRSAVDAGAGRQPLDAHSTVAECANAYVKLTRMRSPTAHPNAQNRLQAILGEVRLRRHARGGIVASEPRGVD